jgi:hypothetical protein
MAMRQNAAITANPIAISKNNIASKLRFIVFSLSGNECQPLTLFQSASTRPTKDYLKIICFNITYFHSMFLNPVKDIGPAIIRITVISGIRFIKGTIKIILKIPVITIGKFINRTFNIYER